MNDDIRVKCEKSFYQELYHFDDTSQGVLFDRTTGRVLLKKTLDTYDIGVYRWLKENKNRHIPFVHSFWEEDGKLVVLEEYIQGEALDTLLSGSGMDHREKTRIVLDICDALVFLHNAPTPIIHRDIKASNVMLSSDGVVKLIDYDAAKTFHAGKKADTTLIGTVGAAAPEQFGFAQSDARTDIYSLGVLIRELFPGDKGYAEIVRKATQMEPKLRYQSVMEMKRAVEAVSAGSSGHKGYGRIIAFCALLFAVVIFAVTAAGVGLYRWLKQAETEDSGTATAEDVPWSEGMEADTEKKPGSESMEADTEKEPGSESKEADTGNDEAGDAASEDPIAETAAAVDPNTGQGNEEATEGDSGNMIVISDSYWKLTQSTDNSYIYYCVVMKNTTAEYVAELPAVNVTARSMDGTVLGTDNMVGASIMPGDCGVIGSMFSIPVTAQSDIDVSFDLEKPRLSSADSDTYPRNSDFTVKGITENTSKLFPTITGEVISHYDKHLDEVKISALLRNKGKIVSAETAFLNDLDPEKPKAFEIDLLSSPPAHDETEIYICEW